MALGYKAKATPNVWLMHVQAWATHDFAFCFIGQGVKVEWSEEQMGVLVDVWRTHWQSLTRVIN